MLYDVGYCTVFKETRGKKDYQWLSGRMFIPCGDGGWQARELSGTSNIKYYSNEGWSKTRTVYNLAQASKTPDMCVLCEGVTDVWRVGERGVAIFGKSLSKTQADILARNFSTVAVALDTDAFEGKNPSGTKAMVELNRRGVKTFRVMLPAGKDPADCGKDEFWSLVNTS